MCVVKTKKESRVIMLANDYIRGPMMKLREELKTLASIKDTTLKDVILTAGLNYNNIINKFARNTIRVSELEKILDVLGKRITFTDKTQQSQTRQQQDKTPPTRK